MRLLHEHAWGLTPAAAREVQLSLRGFVEREDRIGEIRYVAGVDVGIKPASGTAKAAVAVLALPSLELVECAVAQTPLRFPYIPGLLSFREIPVILKALAKLQVLPDVLLCDGQGVAHPRRFGIACHLGVLTGIPALGVAKSRLTGTAVDPPNRRGAWRPLTDGDEVIGAVLRTRKSVKPVFVSEGHRLNLDSAIDIVMRCTGRYRLPETTRIADRIASDRGRAHRQG